MQISELNNLCIQISELQAKIDEVTRQKTELTTQLDELKARVMVELEKNDLKSFDSPVNKITRAEYRSVKILDKYAFMDWLEARGELKEALNVNVKTAQKIYSEAFERAKEKQDVEFLKNGIAGLSEPSVYNTIRITKKRGK